MYKQSFPYIVRGVEVSYMRERLWQQYAKVSVSVCLCCVSYTCVYCGSDANCEALTDTRLNWQLSKREPLRGLLERRKYKYWTVLSS